MSGGGGESELPGGGGGGGTRNWQCSSSSFQLTMRNRSWFLSKMDARNFSSALSPDTDIFPSSPAGGVRKGSRGREPPSRPRPPRGAGPGRALAAPPLPAAATRVRARLENGEEREASAGGRASERGERASARAKTPVRSVDATGQKLDASDHLGNIAEPSAYSLLGGEVAPVLWR